MSDQAPLNPRRPVQAYRCLPAATPFVRLKSAQSIIKLCARTISQIRRGELDPYIAQVMIGLMKLALEAMGVAGDDSAKIASARYQLRRIIEVEPAHSQSPRTSSPSHPSSHVESPPSAGSASFNTQGGAQ